MGQHHALGLAGGTRGVDDGGQIFRLHRAGARVELRIAFLHCNRIFHQLGKALHREHAGGPIHRGFIAIRVPASFAGGVG